MFQFTTKRLALAGGAFALAVGSLVACGSTGHDDASVEPGGVDKGSAKVIEMPEGFRNVAFKCDGGGNMVYSASRGESSEKVGGAIFVIQNDPRCPGAKTTP